MLIETAVYGDCMKSRGWKNVVAVCDDAAPIKSGDVVRAQVGGNWIIKKLVIDAKGRWFFEADDGLAAISRCACVPSAIMKVVERRRLGRTLHDAYSVPAGLGADDASWRVYRAMSADVTGFVPGTPWPGIEAALDAFPWRTEYDAAYQRQTPSFGIIPQNPTTPSEAVLAISQHIAGTLRFTMADPIVRPLDTRFQIIRSLVSSNAAVGTVIYDGLTQVIDLACPSSLHYYYSRPYVNSYFGPYSPNTTGISVSPNQLNTGQILPGAATVIYNDYVASVTSTQGDSAVTTRTTSESGTCEITISGRIQCANLVTPDYVAIQVFCQSGNGAFYPSALVSYRVTTSGQIFDISKHTTFVTSGAGPWCLKAGFNDLGGGNAFTATGFNTRTTIVRV